MSELAQTILARVYSGYIARSLVEKFLKGLPLAEDQGAALLEYLTEQLSGATPRLDADVGLYASQLASAAIAEGYTAPESVETFATVRSTHRDLTYESHLGSYGWDSLAGVTQAIQVLGGMLKATNEVMDACRQAIDSALVINRNPVALSYFTWLALSDAGFANHALTQIVQATGFPQPSANHLAMVLTKETTLFETYWNEHQSELTALLEKVRGTAASPDTIPTGQNLLAWISAVRNLTKTLPAGIVRDTVLGCATASALLGVKEALDTATDTLDEDQKSLTEDFTARLIRYAIYVYGAISYQRENIYKSILVLELDASDPALPQVVVNGDQQPLLADPEKQTLLVQGMHQFAKTSLAIPPGGMTVDFFTKSLPFYAEQARGALYVEDRSENDNAVSRAQTIVRPMIVAFLNESRTKMASTVDIGDVNAISARLFGLVTHPTDTSPMNYLLTVLGDLSGQDILKEIIAEAFPNGGWFTEPAARVFVRHLTADFFTSV